MKSIYLYKNGEQIGPFTEKQIMGRLYSDEFNREDLAWHEGLDGWVSLSTILGSVTPPPLPAHPPTVRMNIATQTPVPRAAPIARKMVVTSNPPVTQNREGVRKRLTYAKVGGLVAVVLLCVSFGLLGLRYLSGEESSHSVASSESNRPKTPELDLPQDPQGHEIRYGTFKVLQVVSPGRVLVQEVIYHSELIVGSNPPIRHPAWTEYGKQVYLLRGVPAKLVDDEIWAGEYFEGGTVTYQTVQQVMKTIRSYIVSNAPSSKSEERRQVETLLRGMP